MLWFTSLRNCETFINPSLTFRVVLDRCQGSAFPNPTPERKGIRFLARIGHFRVPPGLCFKTRVGAQPLISKSFLTLMQIKLIFRRKVVHLASFWNWGLLELGSGLLEAMSMHKVRNHPAKTASWDPLKVFELFKVLVSYTVIWRYPRSSQMSCVSRKYILSLICNNQFFLA